MDSGWLLFHFNANCFLVAESQENKFFSVRLFRLLFKWKCIDSSFRILTFPRFLLVFSRAEMKPKLKKLFLSNKTGIDERYSHGLKMCLRGAKPGLLASVATLPPPQLSKCWPRKSHKVKYRSSGNIHQHKAPRVTPQEMVTGIFSHS